jgi:hypothetical protein
MKLNAALLRSKGWELSEIEHASKVIEQAENKKHQTIILLDHGLYWFLIIVAMCGNVAAAFFLFPFVAFLPGVTIYFILAIIGLCLGALFTVFIRDIEKATRKHHLFAAVIIPIAGVITFIIMAQLASSRGLAQANHSVVGVSLTYMIFFLLPYVFFLSEERFELFEAKPEENNNQ